MDENEIFRNRSVPYPSRRSWTNMLTKDKGISLIAELEKGQFMCKACGQQWSPNNQRGKYPQGWWKCPNGCNVLGEEVC